MSSSLLNLPESRPTRTRVKVCGLTRVEDVHAAIAAGVDAVGFVFVPASKRALMIETARPLFAAVSPFVQTVALFLDAPREWVASVDQALAPDLLQFHGRETGEYCRQFSRPYIKALGADVLEDDGLLSRTMADHATARGFLLDSHPSGELGGTGQAFDWRRWPQGLQTRPLILAGGLTAANVQPAIQTLAPYAVDVSSGVESSAGIKSAEKIQEFIAKVNSIVPILD
ncbi:phosphoribosylanthranilate isomerase [Halothiobacillus sp. DCM-1]|uniref:phosphoribosylanthranilate isomerase n=1 Tax=Halothiobacillus sp. DCM-1 TaxID=3112558 RepID=UPI0032515C11